jgi:starch phosphorylase
LDLFNEGDYYGALKAKQQSENITGVLYPNDRTTEGSSFKIVELFVDSDQLDIESHCLFLVFFLVFEGRELRLKQQYFFVSASLRDILYTYRITFPEDTKFTHVRSTLFYSLLRLK